MRSCTLNFSFACFGGGPIGGGGGGGGNPIGVGGGGGGGGACLIGVEVICGIPLDIELSFKLALFAR